MKISYNNPRNILETRSSSLLRCPLIPEISQNNPRKASWNISKILVGFLVVSLVLLLGILPKHLTKEDQPSSYHKEFSCLAELLYYEARSTGTKGMTAVAHVVQNRVHANGFPSTYCGVSHERNQFSFHKAIKHSKKHNKHITLERSRTADSKAFEQVLVVTQVTLDRRYNSPLKPSETTALPSFDASVLWYCTLSSNPPWASKFKEVYRDRYHKFFKK